MSDRAIEPNHILSARYDSLIPQNDYPHMAKQQYNPKRFAVVVYIN
jgi:hypothetical protein